MKRTKILLIAVVICSVASGALAFKAKERTSRTYYTTVTDTNSPDFGKCKRQISLFSTTDPDGVPVNVSTTTVNGSCGSILLTSDI